MLALIVIAVAALTIGMLVTAIWIGNRTRMVPSDPIGRAQHPDGSVATDERSPLNISEPTPIAPKMRNDPDKRRVSASRPRVGIGLTVAAAERRMEAVVAAKRGRPALPSRPPLDDPGSFDPEDTHAMGVAFEQACQTLGIADKAAPAAKVLATTIIDAGMTGERDAVRLYEAAMRRAANPA